MSANEPRTNNPGLGKYMGRTMAIAVFFAVVFFFVGVHLFYSVSALSHPLVDFILFVFLFFFGLSMGCLVLCARVGPGELPSRFSAARMETFIREELQRVVAKARAARGEEPTALNSESAVASASHDEAAAAAAAVVVSAPAAPPASAEAQKNRWQDLDEEEEHQLANLASTAALTERASPKAAEAELEKAAMEARLRLNEGRRCPSSSEGDEAGEGHRDNQHQRDGGDDGDDEDVDAAAAARRKRREPRHSLQQKGDGSVEQEDGTIYNSADDEASEVAELPAYMSEMMRLRRLRKVRRGLAIVRVSEAAQKVLEAIDSDDFDRKREELGYLIPGANWCRFCNFYQMDDTRHCEVCCRCVYRATVHCICCGQCVGYANSKYYVLFLFYFGLSLLMGNFLDLYCVINGYTFFFDATGRSNSLYYLVFTYSYALAFLVFLLLVQYLVAAGRNVGLVTELLRQQRKELESVRLRNSGEEYQVIMSERTAGVLDSNSSPEQTREPFVWKRAMDTVGEGLPLPLWFWPVPTRPAVKVMDDPEGFWTNLTEAIRIRLRSVADEDDVFTDEDEEVELHDDDDDGAAAMAAATAAVRPLQTPHRAKSTDVTVVPVAVPVAPPAVPALPPAHIPTSGAAVAIPIPVAASAVSPPSATSPSPPIAKAAPVSRKKMD